MRMYLILILSILGMLQARATVDNSEGFIAIEDISYDYETKQFEDGTMCCQGTLRLTVKAPENYRDILVYFSKPFLENASQFFGIKILPFKNEGSSIKIVEEKVLWGTYFRARIIMNEEGETYYTPVLGVNDYIEPEILEQLISQASVKSADTDKVSVTTTNRKLVIDTPDKIHMSIHTLDGTSIFSGHAEGHLEIPLNSGIAILHYTHNNITITKKVSIK